MTGGRYEYINNMNRYTTLMPELGAEVAKQAVGSAKQFVSPRSARTARRATSSS